MTSMDESDDATGETFRRDLGRLLLLAYASGEDVEGEWHLMDTDRMVPDVTVAVTRLDSGPSVPAFGEAATFAPAGPSGFKTRLQRFVLERFADGTDIEGTWEISFARESVPTWEVTVSTIAESEMIRTGDDVSTTE